MEINMASTSDLICANNTPRAERIALLNDELRSHGRGGQIVITRGVHELTGPDVSDLLRALAAFKDFDADSDPHGERDFGIFDFNGREVMFKIDYYSDAQFQWGSNDPANPDVTERVLTVLLPEEY
jgi:hypothetical protein